jgi:DNA polymerase III delta prime subunit
MHFHCEFADNERLNMITKKAANDIAKKINTILVAEAAQRQILSELVFDDNQYATFQGMYQEAVNHLHSEYGIDIVE